MSGHDRPGAVATKPLSTAREIAELLGVSAETVLRWTRRGELPAVRLPSGALRYEAHTLEDWLAGRSTAPPRAATVVHLRA